MIAFFRGEISLRTPPRPPCRRAHRDDWGRCPTWRLDAFDSTRNASEYDCWIASCKPAKGKSHQIRVHYFLEWTKKNSLRWDLNLWPLDYCSMIFTHPLWFKTSKTSSVPPCFCRVPSPRSASKEPPLATTFIKLSCLHINRNEDNRQLDLGKQKFKITQKCMLNSRLSSK